MASFNLERHVKFSPCLHMKDWVEDGKIKIKSHSWLKLVSDSRPTTLFFSASLAFIQLSLRYTWMKLSILQQQWWTSSSFENIPSFIPEWNFDSSSVYMIKNRHNYHSGSSVFRSVMKNGVNSGMSCNSIFEYTFNHSGRDYDWKQH